MRQRRDGDVSLIVHVDFPVASGHVYRLDFEGYASRWLFIRVEC